MIVDLGCASIPQTAISKLARHDFCAIPNWMPAQSVQAVLDDALALEECGLSRRAGVGSVRHCNRQLNEEVRRSSMCPLIPPPRPSAGSIDTRLGLADAICGVRDQLSQLTELGLPRLEPFQTELSYLYYPIGGFYWEHVDVPSKSGGWQPLGRRPEDGGSFSGAALRREIVRT